MNNHRSPQSNYSQSKKSVKDKNLIRKIQLQTNASVTDFVYNHNGLKLALSDSEGSVFLYERAQDNSFVKTSTFQAHDAAIWKLAWSDPCFGELLAVASFKKKVAIFQLQQYQSTKQQQQTLSWVQIANHELHGGSVNFVEWAAPLYGLKLFSAGSDGSIGILEVKQNQWQSNIFQAHQGSITCLSLKPIALNQQFTGVIEGRYPTIASMGKDCHLKIWRHITEYQSEQLPLPSQVECTNQLQYYQLSDNTPHKQSSRTVLFRPSWTHSPTNYQIISDSETGKVLISRFVNDTLESSIIIFESGSNPILKVSQSLTGNMISVSYVSAQNQEKNVLCYEDQQSGEGTWKQWSGSQQQQLSQMQK